MIGIEMKLNIPVHYQMGNPLQQGRKGNNSNKMLDGVVFSCQQIGVNTFYKGIEFKVNSFDSY
jgi:hypothetical protein